MSCVAFFGGVIIGCAIGVDLDEGVRLLQEEHAENMRSVEEIHALRLANVMAMYDAEKKQAEDEHKVAKQTV